MNENMEIRSQLNADSEMRTETRTISAAEMAGILQRFENSLEKLASNLETQSSTLQIVQDDLLLRFVIMA